LNFRFRVPRLQEMPGIFGSAPAVAVHQDITHKLA
jgi:hypothetical protein